MRLFCCKNGSGTYPPAKIVCRVKHVIHVTGRRTSAKSWSLSVVHSLKRASPTAATSPSASVHPSAGERPRPCPCRKVDKRSIRKEHEAQEGAWEGGKEREGRPFSPSLPSDPQICAATSRSWRSAARRPDGRQSEKAAALDPICE